MSEKLKITILGCGSSGGVPRVGGEWGACERDEPKNKRTRCSILVELWQEQSSEANPTERTIVLIDTSPDLREQLLRAKTTRLDAILYTHDHADQTHGLDDVRAIAYGMRQKIPTYMDPYTKDHILQRFKYCFEKPEGRVHPPILELMPLLNHMDNITVSGPGGDLEIKAFEVSHGPTPSFGFMINGKVSYTPDIWDIGDDVLDLMQSQDLWILDALRYNPHPTHAHADKSLQWIARTQTQRAILTNLHIDMDFNILSSELTGNHVAAFDHMQLMV